MSTYSAKGKSTNRINELKLAVDVTLRTPFVATVQVHPSFSKNSFSTVELSFRTYIQIQQSFPMPQTSLKYCVSQEVTEILGVSLVLDLCFNDSGADNTECTSYLIKAIATRAWEMNNPDSDGELLTAKVQELCEGLLVALPKIRYLTPRESLTRGLGFWSNVSLVKDFTYVSCIDRGRQVANRYMLIYKFE